MTLVTEYKELERLYSSAFSQNSKTDIKDFQSKNTTNLVPLVFQLGYVNTGGWPSFIP